MNRRSALNTMAAALAAPLLVKRSMAMGAPLKIAVSEAGRVTRASVISGIPAARVKITRWRPDTCGCELEFVWDAATLDKPELREHIPFSASCCEHHVCHTTPHAAYHAVLAENQAKNHAVAAFADKHGVDAHTVKWAYDGNRNLKIERYVEPLDVTYRKQFDQSLLGQLLKSKRTEE